MSTLRVSAVNNAAASVGGLAIDSSGNVTGALPSPNRNLLYNGAMQVSQRGTSTASITTAGYKTADRWYTNGSATLPGTWTQSVTADAPTGSGFKNCLKMLVTTGKTPLAAGDYLYMMQALEGQDVQRIAKGTASAQQLTLSFWVKSNVTGTYVAGLYDNDNTRHVMASYTISASATWEKKTITFPADTTGAFDNDNASSLLATFLLAAGSTYTSGTLATAWAAYVDANFAVGQTNLAAATNNYWQVTGVQLEVGPVATSFEFKSYGRELRECQRYYYLHASGANQFIGLGTLYNATACYSNVTFPVTMRTAPTASATSGTDYYRFERNGAADDFNSIFLYRASTSGTFVGNTTEISGTAGQAGMVATLNASASVAFSSEL